MKKIKPYLAGPITLPCPLLNAKHGIGVADELIERGFIPFVPHLSVLWQMCGKTKTHDQWLDYDFHWVDACDCLLRLPGESKGADREVEYANKIGKPVFYSIGEMETHYLRVAGGAA